VYGTSTPATSISWGEFVSATWGIDHVSLVQDFHKENRFIVVFEFMIVMDFYIFSSQCSKGHHPP
jgi:hypothetical protein